MRPVAGPDVRPFNWPAVLILLVLGALLFLIWRMWNQFRERTIDPAVRSADEAWDRMDARADLIGAFDHLDLQSPHLQGNGDGQADHPGPDDLRDASDDG